MIITLMSHTVYSQHAYVGMKVITTALHKKTDEFTMARTDFSYSHSNNNIQPAIAQNCNSTKDSNNLV